ncbi:diaminobutyrate acetyltransferase [Ruania alba]|uniref:L-2,4-diaminobutyric acid acetyltransferase n=1 Tax=Ruania alba TaxID=648782 RepID=A0A1H5DKP7_9MICO|nr:diaminobutyrate acetyltransferase [Ruania alba]SED79367.1 diaminobutyrate acetyltransferase [Ruania alba]
MPKPTSADSTTPTPTRDDLSIRSTTVADGGAMWELARECGLDLNSSYAYLILAGDFSASCRLALLGSEPVGYVLGYRPQDRPDHLFVWQVAVSSRARGRGVAGRMLHDLLDTNPDVTVLEATVEETNDASRALFAAIARRRGGELTWTEGLRATDFPDDHAGEPRLEIRGLQAP